jgi:hypothetical protein
MATVTTGFGGVRVWDAKAELTVRNQNGRVEANGVAGTADLETSFAPVKFTGIGKGVRVTAQNSAVTGDTAGENVTVQTTFGSVAGRGRGSAGHGGKQRNPLAAIGGEIYAKTSFAES